MRDEDKPPAKTKVTYKIISEGQMKQGVTYFRKREVRKYDTGVSII